MLIATGKFPPHVAALEHGRVPADSVRMLRVQHLVGRFYRATLHPWHVLSARGASKAVHLIVLLLLATAAHAGDTWFRAVRAESVEITVHVVDIQALAKLALHHAPKAVRHNCQRSLHCARQAEEGIALLFRKKGTNEYVCEIYIADTNDSETLAHEKRH